MSFYVGAKVVTRRGKVGTVVAVREDGDWDVSFYGREPIQLRTAQLIHESEYRRMMRGKAVMGQQR